MYFNSHMCETDHGPDPYIANMEQLTLQNQNFRTATWTGYHLQMTSMCIPPNEEIGIESHRDTDQMIRIEQGKAMVKMGKYKENLNLCQNVSRGDVIFIPAGTWHNIINTGNVFLRVSSVYAPPNHAKGTIHHTRAEAEREGL